MSESQVDKDRGRAYRDQTFWAALVRPVGNTLCNDSIRNESGFWWRK